MILLNKDNLYSTFNSNDFDELKIAVDNISPSMAEYYLNDLALENSSDLHLNKSDIEKSFYLNDYSLYLDYNKNIFLEISKNNSEDKSSTLW